MTKFDMFYDLWDPNEMMSYTTTQPLNDRFFEMGLESTSFLDNLGSMPVLWIANFFMQVIPPLIIVLVYLFKLQNCSVIKRITKYEIFRQDKYSKFNSWL